MAQRKDNLLFRVWRRSRAEIGLLPDRWWSLGRFSRVTDPAKPILLVNSIPKSGGNRFNGSIFLGGTSSGLQSNNLDDGLRSQGLTSVNSVKKVYDVNDGSFLGVNGNSQADVIRIVMANKAFARHFVDQANAPFQ